MENVHAMLARWEPADLDDERRVVAPLGTSTPRFVLVEESRITGEHAYAWGDSFGELLQDSDSEEYAEDWTPLVVVDLEDGVVSPLEVTRVTVASKVYASHGLRHVN